MTNAQTVRHCDNFILDKLAQKLPTTSSEPDSEAVPTPDLRVSSVRSQLWRCTTRPWGLLSWPTQILWHYSQTERLLELPGQLRCGLDVGGKAALEKPQFIRG